MVLVAWEGKGVICEDCGKLLKIISAPHQITRNMCENASISCVKPGQETYELWIYSRQEVYSSILVKVKSSVTLNEAKFSDNPRENFQLLARN